MAVIGALARANAEIRRQGSDPDAGQQRARRALRLADELLDQLELLMLRDEVELSHSDVESADRLRRAAIGAGVRRPRLRTERGPLALMDDVYEIEGHLFHQVGR